MGNEPDLLIEHRDTVTVLTLNRPHRLNALSPGLVRALNVAIDELPTRCRVVVVTANGRAFSAGGDLSAVTDLGNGTGLDEFHEAISATLSRLERLPVPVIAAVQGLTVAGGLELALACDLILAAESASFGDGHAKYGLLPGGGGSVRLPRRIGVGRAKFLMLTGQSVSARTMESWGMVQEVVADDRLDAAVSALAETLVARSPEGLHRMKRLIDDGLQQDLDAALQAEQVAAAEHAQSADYWEGLAAFRERREPRWPTSRFRFVEPANLNTGSADSAAKEG